MTVKSPCVRNCCLGEDDICLGCFRTIDEITSWGRDESIDLKVLNYASIRKEKHRIKYGQLSTGRHDF